MNPERHFEGDNAVEKQANYEGNKWLVLKSRLEHPKIKKQIIDLMKAREDSKDGQPLLSMRPNPDGSFPKKEDGTFDFQVVGHYEAKSREQLLEEYDRMLEKISVSTPLTHDPEKDSTAGYNDIDDHEHREHISYLSKNPLTGKRYTADQLSVIEAHEKGHKMRSYGDGDDYISDLLGEGFDFNNLEFTEEDYELHKKQANQEYLTYESAKSSTIAFLKSGDEIAERMSQLKNYFGMTGDELFTKEHLDYAREHYVEDTGIDNKMTLFLRAITEDTEDRFIELINTSGI